MRVPLAAFVAATAGHLGAYLPLRDERTRSSILDRQYTNPCLYCRTPKNHNNSFCSAECCRLWKEHGSPARVHAVPPDAEKPPVPTHRDSVLVYGADPSKQDQPRRLLLTTAQLRALRAEYTEYKPGNGDPAMADGCSTFAGVPFEVHDDLVARLDRAMELQAQGIKCLLFVEGEKGTGEDRG